MKTNRKFLVAAIFGVILVLAAVFLRRRQGKVQRPLTSNRI
jgi:acid phosphatase family membrane protein YuiD